MTDDYDRPGEEGRVRKPDPTLGKSYPQYEPATVERVPGLPTEPEPEQPPAKPPKRQRVVLADPRLRATASARARVELEEQSSVGALLVDDLVKRQLRAGLILAGIVIVLLGALPIAFYTAPGFAGQRVVGVPLAWFLLAVLPFPLLLLAALAHNRLAERNERDFVDMIEK